MFRVAESTKAASPYVNLGCQCSALTFVDQYGTVQVILSCDWSLTRILTSDWSNDQNTDR